MTGGLEARFGVALWRRDFSARLPLPGATLAVVRYAWTAPGGPEAATLLLRGPRPALAQSMGWLRCPVEISDASGAMVWWGFVDEVEVQGGGGAAAGVGLNGMSNRCQAIYHSAAASGAAPGWSGGAGRGPVRHTEWAEDAGSVAEYGGKETQLVLGSAGTPAAAEQARDAYLALARYPEPVTPGEDGTASEPEREPHALLHCRGWWSTLDWLFYAQARGLEQWTGVNQAAVQAGHAPWQEVTEPATIAAESYVKVGQGFAGAGVAFGRDLRRITDVDGGCSALAAGDLLAVGGSAANDGTYTVDHVHQAAARTYAAGTLAFDAGSSRIVDTAYGLGFLERRDILRVSGSAANDGWYTVAAAGSDGGYVEVSPRPRSDEAAGRPITVRRGNWLVVREPLVDEQPGAYVSVQVLGATVAQGLRLATGLAAWPCTALAVKAGRVGQPGDALRLALCSDVAGRPGSMLAAGELNGSELNPGLSWVEVALDSAASMDDSTPLWLLVTRNGPADAENYYRVAVDEAEPYPRGELWQGDDVFGVWRRRTPVASLVFQALGTEETGQQLAAALAAAPFVTEVDVQINTGLEICPYRAGDRRLSAEVLELLELGEAHGLRLQATVGPERRVTFSAEPAQPLLTEGETAGQAYLLDPNGEVRGPYGEAVLSHAVLAGVWARPTGMGWLADVGWIGKPAAIFISRCEIDVAGARRRLYGRRPAAITG